MKIKKILVSLIILTLVTACLNGCVLGTKKYAVSGKVVGLDGTPLAGVSLKFGSFGVSQTNSEGKWQKSGLEGTVKIELSSEELANTWWFPSRTVTKTAKQVDFIAVPRLKSIQQAIDLAVDGETITVPPGLYEENIDFSGKNITLTGADPKDHAIVAATIIDGGDKGTVVSIRKGESAAVLTGLTIQGGTGTTLLGSETTYGGGIYISDSTAIIRYNIIESNIADYGAGIFVESGAQTISENTIKKNVALVDGGGIYVQGGIHTIFDNLLNGNSAFFAGGGLYLQEGEFTITGNILDDNIGALGGGGGMHLNSCIARITNNIVEQNSSTEGGGIYIVGGKSTISGNMINRNDAGNGGGLFCSGVADVVLAANTFQANRAFGEMGAGAVFLQWDGSTIKDEKGQLLSTDNDNNVYVDNEPDDRFYEHARSKKIFKKLGNL